MDNKETDQIRQIVNKNIKIIRETFEMLKHADSYPVKCNWSKVVEKGQELATQATYLQYLFGGGKPPESKLLKEQMETVCIMLQDLVIFSFGSSTRAGPTLAFCIWLYVGEVIKWTSLLLETTLFTCEFDKPKLPPQVVTAVLIACSDLKKTPATNVIAIGQAMTQVSDMMKFVLHDIKGLKQASSGQPDEASGETSVKAEKDPSETLSPEDVERARLSADIVTELPRVIKELVRCTTGLLQQELIHGGATLIQPLENLLQLCNRYGDTAEDLSIFLVPEQLIPNLKKVLKIFAGTTDDIEAEVENLNASSEDFVNACARLRSSLRKLESRLSCSCSTDLEQEMKNLAVTK